MAAPVENASGVNHHARRMHFTRHYTLGFDLHPAFSENYAVEPPGDHHTIPLDLAFDLRTFAQNYGLLGNDVALDVAVNSEGSRNGQRAFERDALIDETCPFFACSALYCRARPLPRHEIPQTLLHPL